MSTVFKQALSLAFLGSLLQKTKGDQKALSLDSQVEKTFGVESPDFFDLENTDLAIVNKKP